MRKLTKFGEFEAWQEERVREFVDFFIAQKLVGLDVSGPSGDCVLKIGLGMSNKKREKDFACLECVIIQSLWAQNPILKIFCLWLARTENIFSSNF